MEKFTEERGTLLSSFLTSYQTIKELEKIPTGFEDESHDVENPERFLTSKRRDFDSMLAPGQIRILANTEKITYVALLKRWEDDSFVVAPFSHYANPATHTELKTNYDGGMFLQVLQIWNVRTLLDATLRESWIVDRLPGNDIQDAWQLWEYSLGGKAPSDDILKRTALPIYKTSDPRLDYIKEELENFAKLDYLDNQRMAYNFSASLWEGNSYTMSSSEEESNPINDYKVINRSFAMAAGEEESNPSCKFGIKDYKVIIRLRYSSPSKLLTLVVRDLNDELSTQIDGWKLIDTQGEILGEITGGKVSISYTQNQSGSFALLNKNGESVSLEEV